MNLDLLFIFAASVIAGVIAAVSGFGIGSVLTPLFSWHRGTKIAVAIVSIPHFIATAYRCWLLRQHIDRRVFLTFGLASAIGGLMGAYMHTVSGSQFLSLVFGSLLILSALGQLTGFWSRVNYGPKIGTIAGVFSGFLGGLVGNQGGIRTAAMFGFQVPKESFVATATAAALIVDVVRMPIYAWSQKAAIQETVIQILFASVGSVLGTWAGVRWLQRLPERFFQYLVAGLLLILGFIMLGFGLKA